MESPGQMQLPFPQRRKPGAPPGRKKHPRMDGEPETKRCGRCETTKLVEEFGLRKGKTKTYRRSECWACEAGRTRDRWHEDLEVSRGKARAANQRAREGGSSQDPDQALYGHGLTKGQFKALIESQDGKCPICKIEPQPDPQGRTGWHLDHDHNCCPGPKSCGKCIRAALCQHCNQGLGHFRDDPVRLRAAADYLDAHAARR